MTLLPSEAAPEMPSKPDAKLYGTRLRLPSPPSALVSFESGAARHLRLRLCFRLQLRVRLWHRGRLQEVRAQARLLRARGGGASLAAHIIVIVLDR